MNQDPPKIYVVGVGGDGLAGLTSRARELVAGADLLVGSDGALRLLPEVNAERVRIGSDLGEVTERLRERNELEVQLRAADDGCGIVCEVLVEITASRRP